MDRKERVFREYKRSTNMSYQELLKWSKKPCSKKASLSREPIKRNLKLLRKNKEQWTSEDVQDAEKTLRFLSRHKYQPKGEEVPECGVSKRTIALMNWAFNPNK